jgi:hypothetical protein
MWTPASCLPCSQYGGKRAMNPATAPAQSSHDARTVAVQRRNRRSRPIWSATPGDSRGCASHAGRARDNSRAAGPAGQCLEARGSRKWHEPRGVRALGHDSGTCVGRARNIRGRLEDRQPRAVHDACRGGVEPSSGTMSIGSLPGSVGTRGAVARKFASSGWRRRGASRALGRGCSRQWNKRRAGGAAGKCF